MTVCFFSSSTVTDFVSLGNVPAFAKAKKVTCDKRKEHGTVFTQGVLCICENYIHFLFLKMSYKVFVAEFFQKDVYVRV